MQEKSPIYKKHAISIKRHILIQVEKQTWFKSITFVAIYKGETKIQYLRQ